nr:Hsp20 family protein [uncultured Neokomagataea sp.]
MSYDFSPLLRSAIGFERFAHLAATAHAQETVNYPPYNIEKISPTDYAVTMAIAGFDAQNVHVIHESDVLIIRGRIADHERTRELLHRGIATRPFEKRFALADYSEVTQAHLANGILSVTVKQVLPEERRTKVIPVMTEQQC